jgi:hypothetical protein
LEVVSKPGLFARCRFHCYAEVHFDLWYWRCSVDSSFAWFRELYEEAGVAEDVCKVSVCPFSVFICDLLSDELIFGSGSASDGILSHCIAARGRRTRALVVVARSQRVEAKEQSGETLIGLFEELNWINNLPKSPFTQV